MLAPSIGDEAPGPDQLTRSGRAHSSSPSPDPDVRLLEKARTLGAPDELVDRYLDSIEEVSVLPIDYRVDIPWPDVTNNGLQDVMEFHLVMESTTRSGRLEITMRDGLTARPLWGWSGDFVDGSLMPVPAKVGRKGRNGILMLKWEGREVTFLGLSNKGRTVYDYSVGPLSDALDGYVLKNESLVSFDLFDGLKGRATDILLGLGEGAQLEPTGAGIGARAFANVRARVIDGRDGTLVDHEAIEPVLDDIPRLHAAPDADGDGLDDYVAFPAVPDLVPEGQGPPVPDLEADYMRARKGTDGASIWQSHPIPVRSASPLVVAEDPPQQDVSIRSRFGDLSGSKRKDIVVQVYEYDFFQEDQSDLESDLYLIDGETGWIRWQKPGWAPLPIGDPDKDGKRDILTANPIAPQGRVGLKLVALSGKDGKVLYKRKHVLKEKPPPNVFRFAWVDPSGDLEPDGVPELSILLAWHDMDSNRSARRDYYLTAKTGKRLGIGKRYGWIFGAVDGHGDDLMKIAIDDDRWTGWKIYAGIGLREIMEVDISDERYPLGESSFFSAWPARFNRDGCVDFLVSLWISPGPQPRGATFSAALDGGSGRVLWTRRWGGLPLDPPAVRARDKNDTC